MRAYRETLGVQRAGTTRLRSSLGPQKRAKYQSMLTAPYCSCCVEILWEKLTGSIAREPATSDVQDAAHGNQPITLLFQSPRPRRPRFPLKISHTTIISAGTETDSETKASSSRPRSSEVSSLPVSSPSKLCPPRL